MEKPGYKVKSLFLPMTVHVGFTLPEQESGNYCTHFEQGCRHHISGAVGHDLQVTIVLSPNNWPNSSLSRWSPPWDKEQQWLRMWILLISAPPTSRGGASPYHSAPMGQGLANKHLHPDTTPNPSVISAVSLRSMVAASPIFLNQLHSCSFQAFDTPMTVCY